LRPFAIPDAQLIVNSIDERSQERPILRPPRTRVSAFLMERILVSMNNAAQQERVTIRCLKPTSTDNSLPVQERLSLVPSLKHLSPSLPELIRSGSVADTNKMSFARSNRKSGNIYFPIALTTAFALIFIVYFLNVLNRSTSISITHAPLKPPSSVLRLSHTTLPSNRSLTTKSEPTTPLASPKTTTVNETTEASTKPPPPNSPKANVNTVRKAFVSASKPTNTPQLPPSKLVPKHL
jgi:hypothetical protein